MPADFIIDAQLGMVLSRASGALTYAEILAHIDGLLRHPDFRPEFNQIFDFRRVERPTLSSHEITELARRTIFGPKSRRAFIAADDWQFGVGRMFAAHREIAGEPGIVVFRDMKEALNWLSLVEEPGFFTELPPPTDPA